MVAAWSKVIESGNYQTKWNMINGHSDKVSHVELTLAVKAVSKITYCW